ncbi:MAG: SprT-like domain-containing protein [Janthinobacterium lividum]
MKSLALTPKMTAEQTAVWNLLIEEFHRLNSAHFEGRLTLPEIVLSTRKTFGGYYQPSRHKIVLSWQAYREYGLPETLNTFRHEVAHIIHPNHSSAFWGVAYALGVIQRYASTPLKASRRYVYACPACGRRIERRRRLRASSCASCDRTYNPRYALQLIASTIGTGKVSSS